MADEHFCAPVKVHWRVQCSQGLGVQGVSFHVGFLLGGRVSAQH